MGSSFFFPRTYCSLDWIPRRTLFASMVPVPLGLTFLVVLQLFIAVLADGSSHLRASLRGQHRQLQSGSTVRPACRPGYKDVTNGQAYTWSCAFHCEGGPYYATAGCSCACMTPEQEERWLDLGGVAGEIPPGNGSIAGNGITLTRRPVPTRRPYVPVTTMPSGVGEPGTEWEWQPPTNNGYIVQRPKQTTASPTAEDSEDLRFHMGVLALLLAGVVVCTAVVGIVCFNWESLVKRFKKQSKALTVVEPPVFNLQLPLEKSPQPAVEVSMSSLVSTRTSVSSVGSRMLDITSSKVSSKQSSNGSVAQNAQKDTSYLLKPPKGSQTDSATASTCSGTSSGISSVNYCRNFLAQPAPRAPAQGRKIFLPEHACPKNNSCPSSFRLSAGKVSKVQPVH